MTVTLIEAFPPLYKRGTRGEVRVWFMELGMVAPDDLEGAIDGAHRVVSGIHNGAETRSGWTIAQPKNTGRRNATTSAEQARVEIAAEYTKKLERGYFRDIAEIDKVPFTKPMLATDWDKRKTKLADDTPLWAQPKVDGIRCIARADGLWTRAGKPITAVPHVSAALAPLFAQDPELIVDGELYNHAFRDDFNAITSIVRKQTPRPAEVEKARDVIAYHVYDLPSHPGPFRERHAALADIAAALDPATVALVPTVETSSREEIDALYGDWLEAGYEGQMLRLDAPYEFKRSNTLMKRKDFLSDEFPVAGLHEGEGNWRGYAKRFTLTLPDGRTFGAGVRGNQAALRALLEMATAPDWATVRYFQPTPDGVPRFPVVIDWGWGARED